MRFVPIKTIDQEAGGIILKHREMLVGQRTQAINGLRGHASEFGIIAAKGTVQVAALLTELAADIARMMRRMGVVAIYRRPNTSKPVPGHKVCAYLVRNLTSDRPNQVWAIDITYIPMACGFIYLATGVDWFTRRVLSWRVSTGMEVDFCLEAVEEALAKHGRPTILNTDQGSQSTSAAFTGLLLVNNIEISMDGRGAWRDNVFVERVWRSVKYEEVYLRAYDSVAEARASIGRYLALYNGKRPHSSLDARTPDQAYFNHLPLAAAA